MKLQRQTQWWGALTGIGFAVAAVASLAVPGAPPRADASNATVVEYFAKKHDAVLASSVIWFIAAILLLWFLGNVRSHLRGAEDSSGTLSGIAFGGGVFGAALITASFCATNAAAFSAVAPDPGPASVRALYDLGSALFSMSGVGFFVLFAAASLSGAGSGALPRWLCWLGAVAAALQLLDTVSLFATSGELAPGGRLGILEPLFSIAWIVATSVVMAKRSSSRVETTVAEGKHREQLQEP